MARTSATSWSSRSDFPGTQVVTLEQNYRSTNTILRAANSLIEQNTERKPKRLFSELGEGDPVRAIEVEDEHAEARFVAAEIASLIANGYSASEIAVFYRMNAQSRVLEDVLVRQDVPYQVIGGPRFYERAEIRDATAYLSVLVNPQDATSLLRIANRPRRGIGDTSLQRLVAHAENTGRTLFQAMADPEAAGVAAASCRAIRGFHATMESLMALSQDLHVDELLERVLEKTGHLDALEAERTIEARGRIENLQELVGVAREYRQQAEEPSLAGFLQDISLVSDQDTIRDERGLVTLMTLHNAKGLEFRAVFMIGMEEGIFPHSRSIEEQGVEEERRLCYVGHDAAMERLTMTHTLARSLFGRREYNLASRFLDELPQEVERERLRPLLVERLRLARRSGDRAATRHRALDRRLRAARLARRGHRHRDRAGWSRYGSLRVGRDRAEADGGVRTAGEDRVRASRSDPAATSTSSARRSSRSASTSAWSRPRSAWSASRRTCRSSACTPRSRTARSSAAPVRSRSSSPFPAGRPDGGRHGRRTFPTHRRRGVLRAMMRAQLDDVHARGEPLALLWASEDTIYGRFGYGMASQWRRCRSRAALGVRASARARGTLRIVDADEALELFPRVWDACAADARACSARTRNWWEFRILFEVTRRRGGGRGPKRFVVLERTGGPRATRSTGTSRSGRRGISNSELQVVEAIALDGVRRQSSGATSSTSTGRRGRPRPPPGRPSALVAARDAAEHAAAVGDGLWVRLVDVGAALSARAYAADGAVVFDVIDEFCPWNAGRWRLAAARRSGRPPSPQLRLDVSTLGSAYLGGFTFSALVRGWPRRGAAPRRRAGGRDVRGRARALVPRDLLTPEIVGDVARRTRLGHSPRHRALHRDHGRPNPLHYDEAAARRAASAESSSRAASTSGLLNAVVAEDLPGPAACSSR